MDEAQFFKDCIKKIIKFPVQYSEDRVPTSEECTGRAEAFMHEQAKETRSKKKILIRVLGRSEDISVELSDDLNIIKIKEFSLSNRPVSPSNITRSPSSNLNNLNIRVLYKGKACLDDAQAIKSIIPQADLDSQNSFVFNVVIKDEERERQQQPNTGSNITTQNFQFPDQFWDDLGQIIDKHIELVGNSSGETRPTREDLLQYFKRK